MHNIHHSTYPENVNKNSVQSEWDSVAAHEDWQEGCSGLNKPIRWIDHICDNYDAAMKYIEEHDSGWYDQLAVKYFDTPKLVLSKKAQELKRREEEACREYMERKTRIHYSSGNVKSEFVSCKECGSKLSTKHIKTNHCPLCGTDLRPISTLEAIERMKKKYNEISRLLKEELSSLEKKQRKKASVRWLVKIEYHT